MRSKEFYFLTWLAFILAFGFTLVSIWNTDWELVEKGFYTIILGWITFSAFTLVKTLRDRLEGYKVTTEYLFLAWGSTLVSFSIGMISIWNTEWQLVEKGYYWMGLIFVTYTSFALSKEVRDKQDTKDEEKRLEDKEKENEDVLMDILKDKDRDRD